MSRGAVSAEGPSRGPATRVGEKDYGFRVCQIPSVRSWERLVLPGSYLKLSHSSECTLVVRRAALGAALLVASEAKGCLRPR